MYGTNHYAFYSRIFCHGIILNALDEAHTIGSSTVSADGEENGFRFQRPSREDTQEQTATPLDDSTALTLPLESS